MTYNVFGGMLDPTLTHVLCTPCSLVDNYTSYDDCLEDKRENYQNCSVLYCVPYQQFFLVNFSTRLV